MSVEWAEAQRICDLPDVDEAIRNLIADPTNDNATCLVSSILESASVNNLSNGQVKGGFDLWVKESRIPPIRRDHHRKTWERAQAVLLAAQSINKEKS